MNALLFVQISDKDQVVCWKILILAINALLKTQLERILHGPVESQNSIFENLTILGGEREIVENRSTSSLLFFICSSSDSMV